MAVSKRSMFYLRGRAVTILTMAFEWSKTLRSFEGDARKDGPKTDITGYPSSAPVEGEPAICPENAPALRQTARISNHRCILSGG